MKNRFVRKLFGLTTSAFFIWCFLYNENTDLITTEYSIYNEKIPKSFNEYKIAQISDFHNEKSDRIKNRLIEKLKIEKPDIIVITGDFVDSYKPDIKCSVDFLKKIKGIAPIYFVSGNHESRIKDYKLLKLRLKENGVIILNNKIVTLTKNNESINLLGIDDPKFLTRYESKDDKVIESNIKSLKYDEERYNILLSHRPEHIKTYSKANLDLVITGHAHGGQFRIPYLGGLYAPNQGFLPVYDAGLYKYKNTNMIISRGIGNSSFPFRLNNKPELVIINLNR